MNHLGLILLIFAFVCAVLACWQKAAPYYSQLIAASLAFFYAAHIFGGISALLR